MRTIVDYNNDSLLCGVIQIIHVFYEYLVRSSKETQYILTVVLVIDRRVRKTETTVTFLFFFVTKITNQRFKMKI